MLGQESLFEAQGTALYWHVTSYSFAAVNASMENGKRKTSFCTDVLFMIKHFVVVGGDKVG